MTTIEIQKIVPLIACQSAVGIGDENYPLSFGNYFSFYHASGELYCANMWAENLREWLRRNRAALQLKTAHVICQICGGTGVDEQVESDAFSLLCLCRTCHCSGYAEAGRMDEIEVTIVGRRFALVTDPGVPAEWLNPKLCITGSGRSTAGLLRRLCELAGVDPVARGWVCGCEAPEQEVRIHGQGSPEGMFNVCRCGRRWPYD